MSADISNLLSALSTHTSFLPLLHTILTHVASTQTSLQTSINSLQNRVAQLESRLPAPSPITPSKPPQTSPPSPSSAPTQRPPSPRTSPSTPATPIPSTPRSKLRRPRRHSKRSRPNTLLSNLYSEPPPDSDDASRSPVTGSPKKKSRVYSRGEGVLGRFKSAAEVANEVRRLAEEREKRDTPLCQERVKRVECAICEKFLRKEAEGKVGKDGDVEQELRKMIKRVCRHRKVKGRKETPDDYYDLTFQETQTQPPERQDMGEEDI